MGKNTLAHLALLGANLIYGLNYSIAKVALPKFIKPFGFIFIRVTVAGILFWLFHLSIREKVKKRDFPRLVLCGIFGVSVNQSLFFKGLAITQEINASLIMITTPVLVLLLSHLFIREMLSLRKILGILAGGMGAFLLIGFGKDFSFGSETYLGDLFIFLNALSYGLYLVLVKPIMHKYHPLTIIKWVFLFGYLPIILLGFNEFTEIQWNTFTWEIWGSLAYVVIGTTLFAYLLNIFALSKVNPSVVSIYIYLQPFIATLASVAIGNDSLTLLKGIAAILIFTGVYLTSVSKNGITN